MIINGYIVIILGLVLIGVLFYKNNKKKNASKSQSNESFMVETNKPKEESPTQPTSTIRFSEEFNKDKPVVTHDRNHVITTVFQANEIKYKNKKICPVCDVENEMWDSECCLCYFKFNEETEENVL